MVDELDRPVNKAHFSIYAADDTEFGHPLKTVESTGTGYVMFGEMPYGKYNIKQHDTASGLLIDPQTFHAEITADGRYPGLKEESGRPARDDKVVNPMIGGYGRVIVTNQDAEAKLLPGVSITLYDSEGKEVQTLHTNTEGVVTFDPVPSGNYTVKQTSTPGRLCQELSDI